MQTDSQIEQTESKAGKTRNGEELISIDLFIPAKEETLLLVKMNLENANE